MMHAATGTLARALLALGLLGAVAVASGPAASTAALSDTVTICHQTLDPQHPITVITVATASWPAHQAHGDSLVGADGTCLADNGDGYD